MKVTKNNAKNKFIDLFMIAISIFMTFDYLNLIMSGDNHLRRKIVLVIWILSIIGWTIKLVYDLRKKII